MKQIKKCFETQKKAESYIERLYNRYNWVRLVKFPRFSESGYYYINVD